MSLSPARNPMIQTDIAPVGASFGSIGDTDRCGAAPARASATGWRRLALIWGAIALVWGVLLPAVALQPAFQAGWQRLQSQGIDPSAMFYSELELMRDVQPRLDRLHHDHPQLLWRPAIGKPASGSAPTRPQAPPRRASNMNVP